MYNVLFSAKDELDIDLLVKGRSAMLRRTCPEGIDHCHCLNKPGTIAKGSLYFDEDPIQASITHVTCVPGTQHLVVHIISIIIYTYLNPHTDFCYCKDTPTIERDTKPPVFSKIMNLCPRGEMDRCLCHDDTVVKFPFDPTTLFDKCRPKRVRKKR